MAYMSAKDSGFSDSKNHYEILDGLRGVAAVIVVMFHIMENFSGGDHVKQIINHGYLAVDFFFGLSGFVIGYAYDDRWENMTLGGFFKRRLIRLHPMLIAGTIIGAILFYFQAGAAYPLIGETSIWKLLLVMLIGLTMLPLLPSLDIRGGQEMYPLNGPAWSLFFEYVANILYALFIRKFSKKMLALFVFAVGALLVHFALTVPNGDVIGGWSLKSPQLQIGFTRLLYPFFAGLLLSRIVKPGRIKNAFLWSSLLLILLLAIPRIGEYTLWINGIYEAICIVLMFPLVIYIGASGKVEGKAASKICKFLGDISYPIYIVHFPLIYCFTAWLTKNSTLLTDSTPQSYATLALGGITVLVSSVALAYLSLKFYDIPVRKWLIQRFMPSTKAKS